MRFDTVYILRPTLKDKETIVGKIRTEVEKYGKIIQDENLGDRQLAFPIGKYKRGYYGLITFEIETETDCLATEFETKEKTQKLIEFYQNNRKDIIKSIVVKLNKEDYGMEEFA